jgi:hypothetical protein
MIRRVAGWILRVLAFVGRLPVVRSLKRRVIGSDPRRFPRRAISGLVLLLLAISGFGLWRFATASVQTSVGSLPYLRPILQLATTSWTYAILMLLVYIRIRRFRRRRYAELAADVSGYAVETVRQLAYEARTPGGTRVTCDDEDDVEEISARILEALETGEDSRLSINTEALESENADDGFEWVSEEDVDELQEAERSSRTRSILSTLRLSSGVAIMITAVVAIVDFVTGPAAVSELWLAPREVLASSVSRRALLEYGAVWIASTTIVAFLSVVSRRVRSAFSRGDGAGADDEENGLEWLVEWKHVRMDLAATLDGSDLAWRAGLPAAVTILVLLLAARIWVVPWLYSVILAAGVLVGLGNYARVQRRRRRRLEDLRDREDAVAWGDTAALVKLVETPETAMCYGFHAGEKYAYPEPEVFALELGKRMHETVNGIERSPSIMQKYASQLEQLLPDLHSFRDDERKRIMDSLRERVEESSIGIVPKAALIEDVIESEPVERSIVSTATGSGFNPELVRQAYRDIVPAALVEEEIELDRPGVENPETVTAVRLREDPLPAEFSEIRAAFTSQFGNYADADPLYQLPDVEDRLEERPVFAGGSVEPPTEAAHV